jgi:hypothetical protein
MMPRGAGPAEGLCGPTLWEGKLEKLSWSRPFASGTDEEPLVLLRLAETRRDEFSGVADECFACCEPEHVRSGAY